MSEPSTTPCRRHRIEVRVTPEQDALIRQAANLEDTTVTAFVLDTVTAHGFVAAPEHPRRPYRRMKDVRASLDRKPADG